MAEEVKEEVKSVSSPPTNTSTPSSAPSSAPSNKPSSGGGKSTTTIIIIVVVILAILGVGGYFVSRYFAKKLGEKAAESIIGAATGGKVDVNSNGDTVNIKDASGNMQIGTSSKWPDSMPSDVPKFTYGTVNYATAQTTDKIWSVGFEKVVDNAYASYTSTLKSNGWTAASETDIGLVKTGIFEKGTWSLTLSVDPDSKGATLGVTAK